MYNWQIYTVTLKKIKQIKHHLKTKQLPKSLRCNQAYKNQKMTLTWDT